jgi:hypothetical protein
MPAVHRLSAKRLIRDELVSLSIQLRSGQQQRVTGHYQIR